MTICAEAYSLVRVIAGEPHRPVKQALLRIDARIRPFLEMRLGRIEDIWYGHVRLIRAEEMDALRLAAEVRRRKVEAGRAAANELADLYLGVAERLRQVDEDFHGAEVLRLERQASRLRSLDRAGASPVAPVLPLPDSEEGGRR